MISSITTISHRNNPDETAAKQPAPNHEQGNEHNSSPEKSSLPLAASWPVVVSSTGGGATNPGPTTTEETGLSLPPSLDGIIVAPGTDNDGKVDSTSFGVSNVNSVKVECLQPMMCGSSGGGSRMENQGFALSSSHTIKAPAPAPPASVLPKTDEHIAKVALLSLQLNSNETTEGANIHHDVKFGTNAQEVPSLEKSTIDKSTGSEKSSGAATWPVAESLLALFSDHCNADHCLSTTVTTAVEESLPTDPAGLLTDTQVVVKSNDGLSPVPPSADMKPPSSSSSSVRKRDISLVDFSDENGTGAPKDVIPMVTVSASNDDDKTKHTHENGLVLAKSTADCSSSTSSNYDVRPPFPHQRFTPDQQARWDEMYQRLLAYKDQHGSTRVPESYEDTKLANWVGNQRRAMSRMRRGVISYGLDPDRIKLLERVGFEWAQARGASTPGAYERCSWEDMFERLVAFKNTAGHTKVPNNFRDKRLVTWVANQRKAMSRKQRGLPFRCINEEKVEMLDSIGFIWSVPHGSRGAEVRNNSNNKRTRQQPPVVTESTEALRLSNKSQPPVASGSEVREQKTPPDFDALEKKNHDYAVFDLNAVTKNHFRPTAVHQETKPLEEMSPVASSSTYDYQALNDPFSVLPDEQEGTFPRNGSSTSLIAPSVANGNELYDLAFSAVETFAHAPSRSTPVLEFGEGGNGGNGANDAAPPFPSSSSNSYPANSSPPSTISQNVPSSYNVASV